MLLVLILPLANLFDLISGRSEQNVKINGGDLEDKDFLADILAKGNKMQDEVIAFENEVLAIVESNI